eukprot:PhM_4_TR14144/c3_g1_i10/m.104267
MNPTTHQKTTQRLLTHQHQHHHHRLTHRIPFRRIIFWFRRSSGGVGVPSVITSPSSSSHVAVTSTTLIALRCSSSSPSPSSGHSNNVSSLQYQHHQRLPLLTSAVRSFSMTSSTTSIQQSQTSSALNDDDDDDNNSNNNNNTAWYRTYSSALQFYQRTVKSMMMMSMNNNNNNNNNWGVFQGTDGRLYALNNFMWALAAAKNKTDFRIAQNVFSNVLSLDTNQNEEIITTTITRHLVPELVNVITYNPNARPAVIWELVKAHGVPRRFHWVVLKEVARVVCNTKNNNNNNNNIAKIELAASVLSQLAGDVVRALLQRESLLSSNSSETPPDFASRLQRCKALVRSVRTVLANGKSHADVQIIAGLFPLQQQQQVQQVLDLPDDSCLLSEERVWSRALVMFDEKQGVFEENKLRPCFHLVSPTCHHPQTTITVNAQRSVIFCSDLKNKEDHLLLKVLFCPLPLVHLCPAFLSAMWSSSVLCQNPAVALKFIAQIVDDVPDTALGYVRRIITTMSRGNNSTVWHVEVLRALASKLSKYGRNLALAETALQHALSLVSSSSSLSSRFEIETKLVEVTLRMKRAKSASQHMELAVQAARTVHGPQERAPELALSYLQVASAAVHGNKPQFALPCTNKACAALQNHSLLRIAMEYHLWCLVLSGKGDEVRTVLADHGNISELVRASIMFKYNQLPAAYSALTSSPSRVAKFELSCLLHIWAYGRKARLGQLLYTEHRQRCKISAQRQTTEANAIAALESVWRTHCTQLFGAHRRAFFSRLVLELREALGRDLLCRTEANAAWIFDMPLIVPREELSRAMLSATEDEERQKMGWLRARPVVVPSLKLPRAPTPKALNVTVVGSTVTPSSSHKSAILPPPPVVAEVKEKRTNNNNNNNNVNQLMDELTSLEYENRRGVLDAESSAFRELYRSALQHRTEQDQLRDFEAEEV